MSVNNVHQNVIIYVYFFVFRLFSIYSVRTSWLHFKLLSISRINTEFKRF